MHSSNFYPFDVSDKIARIFNIKKGWRNSAIYTH